MADGVRKLPQRAKSPLPELRDGKRRTLECHGFRLGVNLDCVRHMPTHIIQDRAFDFACRIIKLCETLWSRGRAAQKIADQLFDCGTSIGANSEEAEGGQTKPDFTARLAISRKESRETVYWLRLAIASGIVKPDEVARELDEAKQLRAMITSAVMTSQSSSSRGQRHP